MLSCGVIFIGVISVPEGIRTLSVQLAVFVSSGSIRADELSFAVRSRMDVGEFDPMLIPEMPGMPDEFPRLQINTPAGYRLTMSKSRIDFFLALPLGVDESDSAAFLSNCRSLISILSEKDFVFARVGFVRMFFAAQAKADFLIDRLMSISSEGITDVSISFTNKVLCSGRQSNNVFGFSTGQNEIGEPGVALNRDVNTDPSSVVGFGGVEMLEYINEANSLTGFDSLQEFIKVK